MNYDLAGITFRVGDCAIVFKNYYNIKKIGKICKKNVFCIPDIFNMNISHKLFDYTITFVNSQH